jgi:hypothetical protein
MQDEQMSRGVMPMNPGVLMLAGDFSEDYEVMVPFQMLETLEIGVVPGKKRVRKSRRQFMILKAIRPIWSGRGMDLRLLPTLKTRIPAFIPDCTLLDDGHRNICGWMRPYLTLHGTSQRRPLAAICHGSANPDSRGHCPGKASDGLRGAGTQGQAGRRDFLPCETI